ncbi:hypothetical protein [Laspinema sp. D2d]|nr:hypothetical protein [Laspinema sp. D2d]
MDWSTELSSTLHIATTYFDMALLERLRGNEAIAEDYLTFL